MYIPLSRASQRLKAPGGSLPHTTIKTSYGFNILPAPPRRKAFLRSTRTRHKHGAAASLSGRASRPLAGRSVIAAARGSATCAATGAGGERQPGRDACRVSCVPIRGARRRAPRQPADRPGACAACPRAPSSPSIAVGQRACGRPRRGSVAAVLPHWSHDDGRLPEGRLTRPLPQPAEGHGREAWCQHWNGTAGGRWGPRLPGQPPSSLVPHALVRTALP